MSKFARTIIQATLGGIVVFPLACGASSESGDPMPSEPEPFCSEEPDSEPCTSTGDGFRVCGSDLSLSFTTMALASYPRGAGTTAVVSAPKRGTACLSGTLAESTPNNWGAGLVLSPSQRAGDGMRIVSEFNAEALGIAGFRFHLDPGASPTRISVYADIVMRCNCEGESAYGCVEGGRYMLADSSGSQPVRITEPTTVTAWFRDFRGQDSAEPLDTTRLAHWYLELEAGAEPFDYEFCVSDLEFLDDEGQVVEDR